jgi:hypothetical protein
VHEMATTAVAQTKTSIHGRTSFFNIRLSLE